MDLELKDKVVIVTGGAKGIGAAIVRLAAGEGAVFWRCETGDRNGGAGYRSGRRGGPGGSAGTAGRHRHAVPCPSHAVEFAG